MLLKHQVSNLNICVGSQLCVGANENKHGTNHSRFLDIINNDFNPRRYDDGLECRRELTRYMHVMYRIGSDGDGS